MKGLTVVIVHAESGSVVLTSINAVAVPQKGNTVVVQGVRLTVTGVEWNYTNNGTIARVRVSNYIG